MGEAKSALKLAAEVRVLVGYLLVLGRLVFLLVYLHDLFEILMPELLGIGPVEQRFSDGKSLGGETVEVNVTRPFGV